MTTPPARADEQSARILRLVGADDAPDAESVLVEDDQLGGPVDLPDGRVGPTLHDITNMDPSGRVPIVPAWMTDSTQRKATTRAITGNLRYYLLFHLVRAPRYLAKVMVYAPRGAWWAARDLWWWARAEEGNFQLRQHAASTNDAYTWQSLDKTRAKQAGGRWRLVVPAMLAALVALTVLLVNHVVPAWGWWAGLVALVMACARRGRPVDKPIVDRVTKGRKFVKLTAEMVRNALIRLKIQGMADPAEIKFLHEIHRDGPGYLATTELPEGVEASDVASRRTKYASAFRLPLDQVWPEHVPGEHPGVLATGLSNVPVSQLPPARWSLLDARRVDVFDAFPLFHTPRLQVIKAGIMARNWLIGGQPGSGKTGQGRNIALAAALDPRVELRIYGLKGTGDMDMLEPICSDYADGLEDAVRRKALDALRWARQECEVRGPIVKKFARQGKAPDNKVTSELASAGVGLHPVVIVIDEAQELYTHPKYGKEAGELSESTVKLARALGITIVILTQIPDANSIPSNLNRCVNSRFCCSVADQTANDMILGTSQYKNGHRATQFRPEIDAGWGILSGFGDTRAAHAYKVDGTMARQMAERALVLRGGKPANRSTPLKPPRDVLADVARILTDAGGVGLHWEPLAERLRRADPAAYEGATGDSVSALLRAEGVESANVRIGDSVRRGARLADVTRAIDERDSARV
jgi:S-DNA-T family DNA segregation ATPase FtsK/SpoIIIE